MGAFRVGQVVGVKQKDLPYRELATVLGPFQDKGWILALREKLGDRIQIVYATERNIEPYRNRCWRCPSTLDSSTDKTCPRCGWVICPECGACEKERCGSNGLLIHNRQLDDWSLEKWEKAYFLAEYTSSDRRGL